MLANRFAQGYAIGNMAYSSDTLTTVPDVLPVSHSEVFDHVVKDGLTICPVCLQREAKQCIPDARLQKDLRELRELQRKEALDRDTCLRELSDVDIPYQCWIGGYAHVDGVREVVSKPFVDLVSHGLRFTGKIVITESAWDSLVSRSRFCDIDVSDNFVKLLKDNVVLPSHDAYFSLGRMRVVIWDQSMIQLYEIFLNVASVIEGRRLNPRIAPNSPNDFSAEDAAYE